MLLGWLEKSEDFGYCYNSNLSKCDRFDDEGTHAYANETVKFLLGKMPVQ